MPPANQRFCSDHRPGVEMDLRLVVQLELASGQGVIQADLDGPPFDRAHVHARFEELIPPELSALGAVHRIVGVVDQRVGVFAVLGIDAHTDRRGDAELETIDAVRGRDRGDDGVHRDGRVLDRGDVREQNHGNSSPPRRLTVSELRTQWRKRCPIDRSNRSPIALPSQSFSPKRSTSTIEHGATVAGAGCGRRQWPA